ncbi:sigma factor-like helix-turn-helix DNA-binding protein [Dysosmobacter welbionis]|uniref:sigma-70 family RNA polymerase sigma factor n=1 Tax=Dysosmobacter welbionis TaxID=2093857 RepID=UPI0032C1ADFF
MTTINLRDFFYWYKVDEFIKVTDEVAQELRAGKVEDVTHWRRLKRNKANYSLDAGDGIEYEACEFEPSPEEFLARAVTIQRLCCALNRLPPAQGRRIDACYLLGQSMTEIAQAEGLDESSIRESIRRGLERMRKIF